MENDSTIKHILARLEDKSMYAVADLVSEDMTTHEVNLALSLLIDKGLVASDEAGNVWLINSVEDESAEQITEEDEIYSIPYDVCVDIKDERFSVYEYLRKIKSDKIYMNPEFQRKEVWKVEQKSRFIESVILNIPLPPFYVKSDQKGKMIVVDGLQRTTALKEFMSGKLTLCGMSALTQLNGMNIEGFRQSKKYSYLISRIEDKQLNFYVLDYRTPMNVVYDIFNRINTGGTNLEPQEIRNCVFIGNSTRLLKLLAENESFREAIDYGISDERMKLREVALRCISFVINDYRSAYRGSMNEFLEMTMLKLNKMDQVQIGQIERDFIDVMNRTYNAFGSRNFRIPTDCTRGRISIAVMETVFYAFYNLMKQGKEKDNIELNNQFASLLADPDYIDSVRNSTSSITKVKTRFATTERYFEL